MHEKKYYVALDNFERRVVVNCLNEMRSKLIATDKPVEAENEIMLKSIDAKIKRIKEIHKEAGL